MQPIDWITIPWMLCVLALVGWTCSIVYRIHRRHDDIDRRLDAIEAALDGDGDDDDMDAANWWRGPADGRDAGND